MKEQYYSIAIRRRKDDGDRFFEKQDFVFKEIKIRNGSRYWFADPFVFEKDGLTYLFYEAYDLVECKGKIAYSILLNDNCATSPRIVIDKEYHLSFPYIYEADGQVYIMPESCGNSTLQLFRAVDFPNRWEDCSVLLDDVFISDSIIMKDNENRRYLSCFEQYKEAPGGKLFYCWGKHRIYSFGETDGFDDLIDYGVVAEGDFGIRNAGDSFYHKGVLYRVGQNCTGDQYGKGLVFFEVDSVEPYSETPVYCINGNDMASHISFVGNEKAIDGTHTYNSSQHYEIIDFSYMDRLSTLIRVKRSLHIRLRKFFNRRR